MTPEQFRGLQTRRRFLQQAGYGLGTIALAHVMAREGRSAATGAKAPHYAPTAKNVIFLFMEGGPSQMDLFYSKPKLQEWDGKQLPPEIVKDFKSAFVKTNATVWGSPRKFQKHGGAGMEFSDLVPHTASVADDISFVHSMYTEAVNHTPAQALFMSGSPQFGRPTIGAWSLYGLGSESEDLPGYVVLSSGRGGGVNAAENWTSGFLPATYRGVEFRRSGDPILYLSNPSGLAPEMQRARLDAIRDLNQERHRETGDLEIAARIASYELAFRMQTSGPELADFSKESAATKELYGTEKDATRQFARNCLLARRLVERGVRFVMLVHAAWDHHVSLNSGIKKACEETDQPVAALIKDLKQRGLLDSTLVVWGGEFGRTPLSEQRRPDQPETIGRDHHPDGFTIWMAGGGIKPGRILGQTDEFGLHITADKVHVHDLHATMLHCLGLEHTRLTYRHMGRDFRLTDVAGKIVQKLIA